MNVPAGHRTPPIVAGIVTATAVDLRSPASITPLADNVNPASAPVSKEHLNGQSFVYKRTDDHRRLLVLGWLTLIIDNVALRRGFFPIAIGNAHFRTQTLRASRRRSI
jgi:hypothetical protein